MPVLSMIQGWTAEAKRAVRIKLTSTPAISRMRLTTPSLNPMIPKTMIAASAIRTGISMISPPDFS